MAVGKGREWIGAALKVFGVSITDTYSPVSYGSFESHEYLRRILLFGSKHKRLRDKVLRAQLAHRSY